MMPPDVWRNAAGTAPLPLPLLPFLSSQLSLPLSPSTDGDGGGDFCCVRDWKTFGNTCAPPIRVSSFLIGQCATPLLSRNHANVVGGGSDSGANCT